MSSFSPHQPLHLTYLVNKYIYWMFWDTQHNLFLSPKNAVYFIMLSIWVYKIFTFSIKNAPKLKCLNLSLKFKSTETHNILAYFTTHLLLKMKSAPYPYTSTSIKQRLCQFIPNVSQYYKKPTNDPTTQHIFKRQLHVSATKQSHNHAVNKGR